MGPDNFYREGFLRASGNSGSSRNKRANAVEMQDTRMLRIESCLHLIQLPVNVQRIITQALGSEPLYGRH